MRNAPSVGVSQLRRWAQFSLMAMVAIPLFVGCVEVVEMDGPEPAADMGTQGSADGMGSLPDVSMDDPSRADSMMPQVDAGPDDDPDGAQPDAVAVDAVVEQNLPNQPTGIMDPQREDWRAWGEVEIHGNRFMIDEQPYYPKTDFLTAVHPGDDWRSWSSLYYFVFDEARRETIRNALVDQRYNSIYIYTLNQGDGNVSPYGNDGFSVDTTDLNDQRLNSWQAMVEDLLDHGLKPFIWLAGDDSPVVAAMSFAQWRVYIDHMIEAFEAYPIMWVIGLEVDEYWSPQQAEERRAYLASRTEHPIGVHLTIAETRNVQTPYQDEFDFVMGQFNSPQTNAEYAQQTEAYTLRHVPWIASEFNVVGRGNGGETVDSVTRRSRDIGRVIASVGEPPLVAGIGNGIDLSDAPAQPPVNDDPPDFGDVIWLHTNVAAWPETATLSSVEIRGGQICLDYDKANVWPVTQIDGSSGPVDIVSNPWIFIQHEGQWYAGTWEWMRPGQICKAMTSVAGDHIKRPPFQALDWRPTPGATYWFMVSAPARFGQMTVAERSNLVAFRWPGAPANDPDPRPDPQPDPGPDPEPDPAPEGEPPPGGNVIGHIDSVEPDGQGARVSGWACHQGWNGSIEVHVYAGGPAGQGVILGGIRADRESEGAVATACGNTGTRHRFSFQISPEQRRNFAAYGIHAHGISPINRNNLLLGRSGVHPIPRP